MLSLRGAIGDTVAPLALVLVARATAPWTLEPGLALLEEDFELADGGCGAALGPTLAIVFEIAALEPAEAGATLLPALGAALELRGEGADCLPTLGAALEPLRGATLELLGE